jgi:hypothetical protein
MITAERGDLIEETGFDQGRRRGSAVFRTGRRYRYLLTRADYWAGARRMTVIGCNPSAAGAEVSDQTVRRCCWFAAREGCAELAMVNLFALVTTDPAMLLDVDDPVGGKVNDETIIATVAVSDVIVPAWGNMPRDLGLGWRADDVAAMLAGLPAGRVVTFGRTGKGQPRHPCRLGNGAGLVPW